MKRGDLRLLIFVLIVSILAVIGAIAARLAFVPNLNSAASSTSSPTVRLAVQRTWTPAAKRTATPSPLPPQPQPQSLMPTPTLAPGTKSVAFSADVKLSGFIVSGDDAVNWDDPNLHVGFFRGKIFQSLLYFDLSSIPPGSKVLAGDLELVGLSRDFISSDGEWQLGLLSPHLYSYWSQLSANEFHSAKSVAVIGSTLSSKNLLADGINQFVFSTDELGLLEQAVDQTGVAAFRLDGPAGTSESLFTWDSGSAGDPGRRPVLHLVVVPGTFVIVPNVPTPLNVLTAAADRLTATAFATGYGSPTPYPRNYLTATPLVVITAQPTPANVQTADAEGAVATAVALTTGTFTPTPSNWITATPAPLAIQQATALPTPTPTAVALHNLTPVLSPTPQPSLGQLLRTPVPNFVRGNILFLSNRFASKTLVLMAPNGQLLPEQPTGLASYQLAFAREALSPDHTRRAIVAPDPNGVLQIWIAYLDNVIESQVTHLAPGDRFTPEAYDPVWSPDGAKLAYVSTQTHFTEIFVFDLATRTSQQLSFTAVPNVFNQRPSWSPDSSKLVFKSNREGGHFQIWMMNADGSNPHNLSQSDYEDIDPIWVK